MYNIILSDLDKKILTYIELRADATVPNIAKKLNLRTHTVYYVINKLKREGIIKKVPFINMARLGYSDYYLFFSLSSHDSSQRKELIQYLLKNQLVTWFVELGGEYQYISALYVKNTIEFSNFLLELSTRFGGLFFKKAFSLHTKSARFNRLYLFPESKRQVITTQATEDIVTVDELDHRILSLITEYSEKSYQEIAKLLNIPFSTLYYRLQILKKKDVVGKELYFVDTTKLAVQAFELLIYTKGLNSAFSDQLFEFAEKHPHIVHFVQSIGEWDFELGIEVETMYDATRISEELYDKFGNTITTITTIPLFKQLKFKFYRSSLEKKK